MQNLLPLVFFSLVLISCELQRVDLNLILKYLNDHEKYLESIPLLHKIFMRLPKILETQLNLSN